MRKYPALFATAALAVASAAPAALAADGITAPAASDLWPQWQARLTVSSIALSPVALTVDPARSAAATGLVSNVHLDVAALQLPSLTGGLRATSGLLAAPRTAFLSNGVPLAAETMADTLPYLGIGYTGLSVRRSWGVTADLGIVAEHVGSAGRSGRSLFGGSGSSWDGALRDLRLSPLLQVGLSYWF